MTGEITLRGKVLAIGGLKEKTMAAYRAGVKTVCIPKENEPDIDELDDVVKNSLKFVVAEDISTVLETALVIPNCNPKEKGNAQAPHNRCAAGEKKLPRLPVTTPLPGSTRRLFFKVTYELQQRRILHVLRQFQADT